MTTGMLITRAENQGASAEASPVAKGMAKNSSAGISRHRPWYKFKAFNKPSMSVADTGGRTYLRKGAKQP
jgi:hypothetical protein